MNLSSLFFSFNGRIGRTSFFLATLFLWTGLFNIVFFIETLAGKVSAVVLIIPFLWCLSAVSVKRYHDMGKTGRNLLLVLIPVIGPVWVFLQLISKKGMRGSNRYGESPNIELINYAAVSFDKEAGIVNDVTQINPVKVKQIFTPTAVEEIKDIVKNSTGPISIGGGHFSMGGQTSSPGSIHIDMRQFNKIINFSALNKTIRVQSGTRWCDIQRVIDNQNLSIKIMQTYSNFTVGGSLSVNSHGRYVGMGPVILSVRSVTLMTADGELIEVSPSIHPELFYGVVGGYGALGIIIDAELDLAENVRVERDKVKLKSNQYLSYFKENIRNNESAVFHNADIYPPHYTRLRAVTWTKTDNLITEAYRLMPLQKSYPIHRYFYWAFSETHTGKWRREFIIEPILYSKKKVHWRNYEAGYDVAELEPSSRKKSTYVLQEYFVPIDKFDDFVPKMAAVFKKHKVNVINVSVRHALADPGTYLAWAQKEVFAFVVYYKQGTSDKDKETVGIWTRELIDAVLSSDGTYYLPYQPHATAAQFHNAYPRANELFKIKQKLDPDFRFRNSLWNKYYAPTLA